MIFRRSGSELAIQQDAEVADIVCDHCGTPITRVTAFINKGGAAHASYWAFCHHRDGHEVFIEVILSPTWDEQVDDHLMFACRVGAVDGQDTPAATLIDARPDGKPGWLTGQRLTREEGLKHDQLAEFWRIVDHVLEFDPVVHTHMYGSSR